MHFSLLDNSEAEREFAEELACYQRTVSPFVCLVFLPFCQQSY